MSTRRVRLVTIAGLSIVVCFLLVTSRTRAVGSANPQAAQPPAGEEKTTEQVYKNIQVLKDLRAAELDGAMYFMCAALGVGCTYCHTNSWDSDAKSAKLAARRMITMTRAINKDNFNGTPAVTCYTCHRGQHNSVPNPPADLAASSATDPGAAAEKPPSLPSTDEIINRYVRAIGNEAAIDKLKTRVSRGNETTTNWMTPPQKIPIEILQAAPDKMLIVRTNARGTAAEGFDGSKGWTNDARGLHEMTGKELAVTKREADFFRYLKLKETYPQLRLLTKERIGSRDAYVVGATSREDDREKLYFDVESGLLIRKYVAFKTAFGSIPEVTDFDDYREVGGLRLPFTISWSRPPFGFVRKFTEIELNGVIDGSRFEPRTR